MANKISPVPAVFAIAILIFSDCKGKHYSNSQNRFLTITGRYCSAFDTISHSGQRIPISNASNRQMDEIEKILNKLSLPKTFLVFQGKVNNALALYQNNQYYIILNSKFLNDVDNKSSDYWLSMYLISHEIGHLLASHLLSQHFDDSVSKQQELQADYFAGATLSRMNCPLNKAKLIFNGTWLQKAQGSKSHPASVLRMESIENGWKNNLKSILTESDPPVPDNIESIDSNNSIYKFSIRDLSPINSSPLWLNYLNSHRIHENIGEGTIIDYTLLQQAPPTEFDMYTLKKTTSDTIRRMIEIYPELPFSVTFKIRKWISTTDLNDNVPLITVYFHVNEIMESDFPLDKYLQLIHFAYDPPKMEIYRKHFVVGQPIKFKIEEAEDLVVEQFGDKKTYYLKELQFLPK